MQVIESLHELLARECPHIHRARLNALMTNVAALLTGRKLSVTGLGRALGRYRHTKHAIKQSDRLVGNVRLDGERQALYRTVAKALLGTQPHPLVIIDWSDYTHNRSHILLRASVPVGGRALTLYEEVHPLGCYGNAAVEKAFLHTLLTCLSTDSQPIIVTDAGFIGPWTRCVDLYPTATSKARYFGPIELTCRPPITCHLHVMRKKPQGRHEKTASGRRAARKATQDPIVRETQPWLIVTPLEPITHNAKHIIQIYKTRMQIELAFREFKNTRAGLALRELRSRSSTRLSNLLLVGMLACFCLWLIGRLAIQRHDHYLLQANTQRHRNVLSVFFVACQLVKQNRLPTNPPWFFHALELVHDDIARQDLT